ncbi:MAG TPA: transposase [Gemmataceae bacterium]|jgi:transposase|nr:transposase [Gemmataceae bacterium]
MNPREQRGLVIAALCKLNHDKETWIVPSQSGAEKLYRVNPMTGTCTCPDHQEGGFKCKHVYAVEFTMKREVASDGTITETKTMTFTEKKTYRQNWPAYNAAQSVEKDRVQELLADLVKGIPDGPRKTTGRKPHSYADALFAMVLKVYCTLSTRRSSSDLREAHQRGYTSKEIPGMKVAAMMENPAFTPILKELIRASAAPLASVETEFAIDSSGFSTSKFERWYDEKYGVTRQRGVWVKVHIACGVKTNVVTAVRILDKDAADSPQFIPLVKETAREFTIGEVSADKAYTSLENFEAVAGFGGTLFAAFKTNATGAIGGLFQKMFHYFQFKQDEYLAHYHKRSNVESTFSMIKRKFGDAVRSKTETAMVNEVLCKILCHNLCVLIQEQHELGIDAVFWKGETKAVEAEPMVIRFPSIA